MAVLTRRITAPSIGGLMCLGAVRTSQTVRIAFPTGTPPEDVQALTGATKQQLLQIGRGLMAILPATHPMQTDEAELDLFHHQNVLVAFRNGETAEAAADWLAYHKTHHSAETALILDRDPPDQARFANDLATLNLALPVTVVSTDHPLGQAGAPDARDPALAPAAPRRPMPAIDPWHAPLGEITIFELLRHRFLANARAFAFVDIADLLMPAIEGTVFDRATAIAGSVLLLKGVETYPWRLRQGHPAPHSDHISQRQNERRTLVSWAAAPGKLPTEALWKPARPQAAPLADVPPAQFCRAMGVVFAGAPVNAMVRKADLREDPQLLAMMTNAFDKAPLRLPTPEKIPPRPKTPSVTIVTAMKNEGPFILDWIAHNRAIGIDRHLVYTNDCADGTEHLLDLLATAGVARRDNPYRTTGKVPQHAAFRAAETEDAVAQANWLLTLDVDEYINIHKGEGRIADLLAAVPNAHAISMSWRMFGNAGQHAFRDAPVTQQFTKCAPAFAPRPIQAWGFKSLFRNEGLFRRMGVHRPRGLETSMQNDLEWVDGEGRIMPPAVWRSAWRFGKTNWGYGLASINHYAVRSAESFLVKRDRGRVNHTARDQGEAYWFRMNHNAEEDLSIRRLDADVAKEKAALLALPGVAQAHATSVEWHQSRIVELQQDPEQAALYAAITTDRMEHLSRMATYFGSNVYMAGPQVIPADIAARDPAKQFFFTVDPPPT